MGLTLSTDITNIIGIVFSGVAIALAVFECFVRKVHSRALDYIQWGYILSLVYSTNVIPFSPQLYIGSSLLQLNGDALSNFYCPMGDYVCSRPFALSFLAILVGFLIIVRLITIPEKVREKGLIFPRIYRLFKGLIKWFYLPLMYLAIATLIGNTSSTLIPAIVVLAVLIVFPIVQLILYKFFDQEG